MSSSRKSTDRSAFGNERSDLFKVDEPRHSIPPLRDVPETPEERRRRSLIRIALAIAAVVTVIVATAVGLHLHHESAVRSAVFDASESGRTAALLEAYELLAGDDAPEDLALRARLRAAGALEHGRAQDGDVARELLGRLEGNDENRLNARVATAYLALAEGSPAEATRSVTGLVLGGRYAAEGSHALARVLAANGNLDDALGSASVACEQRPGAPRYHAHYAVLLGRSGRIDEAREQLEQADPDSPAVRLARARVTFRPRAPLDEAIEDARFVAEAKNATPPERAFALQLMARHDAEQGEGKTALERTERAISERPPGSEPFSLLAIETYLRAGATAKGAALYRALPEGTSAMPGQRARLGALLALEQARYDDAENFLERTPESPLKTLLEARLAQARGYDERAQALYREAAEEPELVVEAHTRLGAMLLDVGKPEEALALMEEALQRTQNHPEAVPVAVQARIASGNVDGASRLAERALAQHPGDPRLLAARARVEMATEQWDDALATLRAAAAKQPSNADLHAFIGEAAAALGKTDAAIEAFAEALELASAHPKALAGRLELAVAGEDLDEAKALLERVDEVELTTPPIDRARARYFVLRGVGEDGVGTVRRAIIRRGKDDSELWLALGRLQAQAEKYGASIAAFGRALDHDPGNPRALVGRALAQVQLGRTAPADKTLDEARAAAEERDPGDVVRARIKVVEGLIHYRDEHWAAAANRAQQALELDPRCARAHVLLADVAAERKRDPNEHLEAALEARAPPPMARGKLALELRTSERGCELAHEYRDYAPGGRLRRSVVKLLYECRRR